MFRVTVTDTALESLESFSPVKASVVGSVKLFIRPLMSVTLYLGHCQLS